MRQETVRVIPFFTRVYNPHPILTPHHTCQPDILLFPFHMWEHSFLQLLAQLWMRFKQNSFCPWIWRSNGRNPWYPFEGRKCIILEVISLMISSKTSGRPFHRFLSKSLLYFISLVAFGERKQETNTSWTERYLPLSWELIHVLVCIIIKHDYILCGRSAAKFTKISWTSSLK